MHKLLIANRGEIACRIARTARAMGIATVAVHSDPDAASAHVAACDEAVSLGGATPAESYLRADAVIAAAQATGADAIHPGYGFLSENPDFVDSVEASGLIFVGPSAKAIRAMGLKDAAKAVMEAAGVPVVPGYHGNDQADATLANAADEIGYPVMIKAVAGGGGKGMRLVDGPQDFAANLASARAEAEGAFGNADVLIEKAIQTPRHIEVQVFGDGKHAVHLYERDCSLQRRHQKVIEEAPAPGMTAEVRAAMGAAAVRAAEAIGYAGAGTIEFIVDGTGPLRTDGFWFMEMNTRLQVEHPVTEAVTGVDLVEWQLRVARGEPLPLRQDDITISGHAVEARLYAEDADAGFLPAIGRLDHLAFPADLRVDSGVRAGDVITPYYDPMIAKLIVHGPDRDAAFAGLERGLAQTQVAGLVTNAGFLRRLVQDADVRAGQVETGLIARRGAALTDDPVPCARTRAIATVAALGLEGSDPFTLWSPLTHHPALEWKGEALAARVTPCGPGQAEVTMDGETRAVAHGPDGWRVDGAKVAASVHMSDRSLTVFWGAPYTFGLPDPRDRSSGPAALGDVVAPMPGLVRAVHVAQGDTVAEGDVLAVLEAMKMEHALTAPRAGVVVAVDTAAGAQVVAGARLLRLEEGEAE